MVVVVVVVAVVVVVVVVVCVWLTIEAACYIYSQPLIDFVVYNTNIVLAASSQVGLKTSPN